MSKNLQKLETTFIEVSALVQLYLVYSGCVIQQLLLQQAAGQVNTINGCLI